MRNDTHFKGRYSDIWILAWLIIGLATYINIAFLIGAYPNLPKLPFELFELSDMGTAPPLFRLLLHLLPNFSLTLVVGYCIVSYRRVPQKIEMLLIPAIIYCLYVPYILYWIIGVSVAVNFLQGVSQHILAFVGLLGVFSVGFSNLYRYTQSKEYGIPFRVAYHNIHESIDIFVLAFVFLGANIGLPVFLSFSQSNEILSALLIVLSLSFGCFMNIKWVCRRLTEIMRLEMVIRISLSIVLCLLAIVSLVAYLSVVHILYGHSYEYLLEWLIAIDPISVEILITALVVIYNTFTVLIFYLTLRDRIKGMHNVLKDDYSPMTTNIRGSNDIESGMHIVAMRYSSDKWIMIPCQHFISDDTLRYKRGEFIIKELDGLTIIQNRYKNVKPFYRK